MIKTKTKIVAIALVFSFAFPVGAAFDGTQQVKAVVNGKKKNYKVPVDSSVYWTLFDLPERYCRDYGYTTDASLPTCSNSLIYDRGEQKGALAPLVN